MSASIDTLFEVYPDNPLATVPLGLRVNDLLYGHLDGADAVTGVVAATVEAQLAVALAKVASLVRGAGASLADIEELTAVYDSEAHGGSLARGWQTAFSEAAVPFINEIVAPLAPGRRVELQCRARIGGAALAGREWVPVGERPLGQRLGPSIFAPMIGPGDPRMGEVSGSDTLDQLRSALRNAGEFLAAAGSGWHEVARATIFMNPVDLASMNTAWAEVYPNPDDRAPHKYVPVALPEGWRAAVQVLAVASAAPRQVIELESIRHGDWMTMAALTANVVTSSRIIAPRSKDAAVYAGQVLDNIETIMKRAGVSLESLTQVTAFIGEPAYRDVVESELRRRLGEGRSLPVMHYVEADLGGVRTPRMEILGLIR